MALEWQQFNFFISAMHFILFYFFHIHPLQRMGVLMASLHLSRGQQHSIDCLSVIALSLPVRAVACLVFYYLYCFILFFSECASFFLLRALLPLQM